MSTNPISQGMQLGLRAEKLLHVPWGVVGLGCMLESPQAHILSAVMTHQILSKQQAD